MSRFRAGAASAALAAAFAGVALGARAGNELERTATVELLLVLVGVTTVGAALLLAPRDRVHGGPAIAAFAALGALTALSLEWSIAPGLSYVETGRTLAYLAVFSAAVAGARLFPDSAATVLRGVLLAAVAIAGYGLATRVWPGSFDESLLSGRISEPFGYWNALAGTAALGLVPALWLGARRTGTALGRAFAYPAAGLLLTTVLIAQSRGALIAAALASVLWLAIVPLRLRTLAILATAAAGATPVAAWALSKDVFKQGLEPLGAREAVAGDFGLILLAALAALFAIGLAVEAIQARSRPSVHLRVRAGVAIAAAAALVSLGLLTSVAASDRGLTGTVSDRIEDFTNESAAPPVGGGRLGSTSSSRAGYWGQAWDAFEEKPTTGLGAGSFELARLRYRDDGFRAGHAHGFVHQTLVDLGLLGGAAALALLAAWLVAATRSAGLRRRRAKPAPWTSERSAVVALALVPVTYGIQALADWSWFVPGITAMALAAAGYVAGSGPPRTDRPSLAISRTTPLRVAMAIAVALVGLACAWTIWQPVAAERAVARSYGALDAGRPAEALRETDEAREANPHSADPLYARADALAALDRRADALRALRQAALDHPRDPTPWVRIASFQLHVLNAPNLALRTATAAFKLDPYSQTLPSVRDEAIERVQRRATP